MRQHTKRVASALVSGFEDISDEGSGNLSLSLVGGFEDISDDTAIVSEQAVLYESDETVTVNESTGIVTIRLYEKIYNPPD